MDIVENLGIFPGLGWLFELPLSPLMGVYVLLVFPFILALLVENRVIKLSNQYISVWVGYPALAIGMFALFWSVQTWVRPGEHWYQGAWFHSMLLGTLTVVVFGLRWLEWKETRVKTAIYQGKHNKLPTTTWLNTDHKDDYPNDLKFGVAYSRRQHLSPTGIALPLIAVVMFYAFGVLEAAAVTQLIEMAISLYRSFEFVQMWMFLVFLVAVLFSVATIVFWARMVRLDNIQERPTLTDVHPDTGWFPILRRRPHIQQLPPPPTRVSPEGASKLQQDGSQPSIVPGFDRVPDYAEPDVPDIFPGDEGDEFPGDNVPDVVPQRFGVYGDQATAFDSVFPPEEVFPGDDGGPQEFLPIRPQEGAAEEPLRIKHEPDRVVVDATMTIPDKVIREVDPEYRGVDLFPTASRPQEPSGDYQGLDLFSGSSPSAPPSSQERSEYRGLDLFPNRSESTSGEPDES